MQLRQTHIRNEPSSGALIREDARELEDAVSKYLPVLYRRAYRYVGDVDDAEDAVQDGLLSAYKHLDQFRGTAKMTTWLTSIVTNSALTQLRRRPRQPHLSLDEQLAEEQGYFVSDRLADARPNPEDECINSNLQMHLMHFVTELSPSLRQAIQLHDLDGLTTSEAAHILGVPEGTLKARVSRARSKLRRLMCGARGSHSHPMSPGGPSPASARSVSVPRLSVRGGARSHFAQLVS
jgi:RNA polymerase sigma-70 factor, ECF subfamily